MVIDLGSSFIRIAVSGEDSIYEEASAIAVYQENFGDKHVLAIGSAALEIEGKTPPEIHVYHPIKDGHIVNYELATLLLKHLMIQIQGRLLWVGPSVLLCVSHDASPTELKEMKKLVIAAGARRVQLIDRSLSCALGVELPIHQACGHMIVDIGGDTTGVTVLSLGGVAHYNAIKVGGNSLNKAIIRHLEKKHKLLIGNLMAEELKQEGGSAMVNRVDDELTLLAKGKCLQSGYPKGIQLPAKEISDSMGDGIKLIVESIRSSVENIVPELAADIVRTGMIVLGGSAKIRDMDIAIGISTQHPVVIPDDPETSSIIGAWDCPLLTEHRNFTKR